MKNVKFSSEELAIGGQAPLVDLARQAVTIVGAGDKWKKGGVTILLQTDSGAQVRTGAKQLFNALQQSNDSLSSVAVGDLATGVEFIAGSRFEIESSDWTIACYAAGSADAIPAGMEEDFEELGASAFATKYSMTKAEAKEAHGL